MDQRIGLLDRLAACFTDHRNPESIEHSVRDLVAQRDLTGERRVREQDRGNPLAASSTLNRLELGIPKSAISDRYKRIAADNEAMDRLLVDLFLESYRKPPQEIWLDLDATDDPPEAAENRCPPAPDSAQGLAVLLGSVFLRQ